MAKQQEIARQQALARQQAENERLAQAEKAREAAAERARAAQEAAQAKAEAAAANSEPVSFSGSDASWAREPNFEGLTHEALTLNQGLESISKVISAISQLRVQMTAG